MENPVADTAYIVAGKRILEQANSYRQDWTLLKQPSSLTVKEGELFFSKRGWVMPKLATGEWSCEHWWEVLYPGGTIFNDTFSRAELNTNEDGVTCHYEYKNERVMSISLVNERFSVNVILVAK
ncbi:hypothetical protein RCJ22_09975 [Vibrio sp. FNV 38]|nr:hypothetical protein [Vibrio sp. FNV 38]